MEPERTESEKFLTVDDIAKLLQVNKQFAYRLLDSGELPYYQFGKIKRVMREDWQAFLSSKRRTGQGGPDHGTGDDEGGAD
ncbi:hypothetical protein GURASL_30200 [Geotalea uraniireducens]|uniref:Helix-turn-helix domain-containing protein n=1 Tax=Geotalea uraniireducens TaxID=351604 RepID=A0ABN6VZD3_9BACT|nr:helix-turn-helix domain-containing protein [Geotalea uraniireducens]BDV44097.1 hypothetical protein GURASL_30200 [Geotalea uraniireducens]